MAEPVLQTRGLTKVFARGARRTIAVNHVDLDVAEGTCLGVVGESGSGKSTLARMIVGLVPPTSGSIWIRLGDGGLVSSDRALQKARKVQMVFQDPYSSLNPAFTVWQTLAEGICHDSSVAVRERRQRAVGLLDSVNLPEAYLGRRPHELSGGERQRVGIARALSVRPDLLIADEPVSSLDVSVQAQILNLLLDLRGRFRLTLVFISHDLAVVRYLCDEVTVMRDGRVVEAGPIEILDTPQHPYTQELLAAAEFRTARSDSPEEVNHA